MNTGSCRFVDAFFRSFTGVTRPHQLYRIVKVLYFLDYVRSRGGEMADTEDLKSSQYRPRLNQPCLDGHFLGT
jgi:hypothetical protein